MLIIYSTNHNEIEKISLSILIDLAENYNINLNSENIINKLNLFLLNIPLNINLIFEKLYNIFRTNNIKSIKNQLKKINFNFKEYDLELKTLFLSDNLDFLNFETCANNLYKISEAPFIKADINCDNGYFFLYIIIIILTIIKIISLKNIKTLSKESLLKKYNSLKPYHKNMIFIDFEEFQYIINNYNFNVLIELLINNKKEQIYQTFKHIGLLFLSFFLMIFLIV